MAKTSEEQKISRISRRKVKEHEDKYMHIPKWVVYFFTPVYVPIWIAVLIILTTIGYISKILLIVFSYFPALISEPGKTKTSTIAMSYKPNFKKADELLYMFTNKEFDD